ncbi:MAG TPA: alanine--tRNA ligase [Thermoplasmata archaeon]|nr:alanine--tRNA ligase [Thermoplasmata archaeon]
MDSSEYDLAFFHRGGFHRRTCVVCGHAFWTLGEFDRCQEAPCRDYGFVGRPLFARPYDLRSMRETYLSFFEHRGHTRIRRYPTVARWRNDVFFTQASIYDFQPWVTNGTIPPPANPLTLSQPVLRFIDLEEVGRSGRHFTLFEMMAHHAFNRPDHEVYFKERCTELCHELLTGDLGLDPKALTYKEEVWEGGGNVGPSLSVSASGLELATLVFMMYVRDGERFKPMPLQVVDTGYGLERFVWASQGTKSAYEAVFGAEYEELRRTFAPRESALLIDHAKALNFLLTDGVVPSNSKEGYFVRLLLRRSLRILQKTPEAPDILSILDRAGREIARDFPEVGAHRDDLHKVVLAEVERYEDTIGRARQTIRRTEERVLAAGGKVGEETLIEWYDSLGVPPDLAIEELSHPPAIPEDFYAKVAERHENEGPTTEYADTGDGLPELPSSVPPTEVLYYLDPYTTNFEAHVVWSDGPLVVLDRTYFYPTGGGQVTDTGSLGDLNVIEVARRGPWVFHRTERSAPFHVGDRLRAKIDTARRTQLMQHHTATHLLNGALREVLGPHVWQAGAYKGPEAARIDVTHYRALTKEELHKVERRVNQVVRENRPVKSYFETRGEAERRFGFTLYQGGAVPGRDLRIVEIEGFDVEACGGTHCTHTSEVGAVAVLGVERIQDGVVRLSYVSGERALDVRDEHEAILAEAARRLGVPVPQLPDGIDRLLTEVEESRRSERERRKEDLGAIATRLLADSRATESVGAVTVIAAHVDLDRNELMELSRRLTKEGDRVAVLASERDGRGTLFVGSTSPQVSAQATLEAAKDGFQGKGGGNASAATAVGEPGAPLRTALELARKAVSRAAGNG